MKTILPLMALVACFAVAIAVPIVEDVQYIHADPKDLLAPLDDIVKEIKEEEREDQQKVDEDKARLRHAKKDELREKGEYEAAETDMKKAHKSLDDQQTLENKRKAEYSTNNEVRAQELEALKKLRTNTDSLVKIGPQDGTLGTMPASKVILPAAAKSTLVETATQLVQTSSRPEYDNIVTDLQRKGTHTDTIYKDIQKAMDVIDAEDKKDAAEVNVEIQKTRAARDVYDGKEAERVTAMRQWEEAQARTAVVVAALAETEKAKADADALRNDELKTIEEAKKMVAKILAVRTNAGPAPGAAKTTPLIEMQMQAARANSATEKLKAIVAQLRKDVKTEEAAQLKVLNMMKARERAAFAAMKAAESKWEKQKVETRAAYTRYEKAHGEWEGSEMALAQEQAVAETERTTINQVRTMLKKLEAASLKTLGNCPEGADGTVCNGQGKCQKEKNGLGAKCICTGYGRTGFDCGLCKFGFKDVNGACTKVFETAVNFLQVDNKQYTADDLNSLVTDLQEGRIHKEEGGGIEKLLKALEAKLDQQEKLLIEESTKARDVRDIFSKHWNANKTLEASLLKDFKVKSTAHKKAYKSMQQIQAMYDFEHPLRMQELKLMGLLDKVILRLEGKAVYNGTRAPTPAATKSAYTATKAPTTA